MIFSIVIPVYNEEESVGSLLPRVCAAAESIRGAGLGILEVEVIIVDDGSSDATARLADIAGVRLIRHEKNRGYGAALKTGFAAARGEWLGFLDGDGTCDPEFFRDLLAEARLRSLDLVLGSRLHSGSRIPFVRALGNRAFRALVGWLGEREVADVASGMRVLRRDALARLYPLPDGMNFTPAMSVRAVLDPALSLAEIPMPYRDRVGASKLSVVADGLRFFYSIVETALLYRPLRIFGALASVLTLAAAGLLGLSLGGPAAPVWFYFQNGFVAEWMVFRLVLTAVLLASAVFLAAAGLLAQSLVAAVSGDKAARPGAVVRRLPAWGAASLLAALLVNFRPLSSYLETGEIPNEFWIFPVVGGLFAIVGIELFGFWVLSRIAEQLDEKEFYRENFEAAAVSRRPSK